MAYGIVNRFDGGTKQNYDSTVAVVHPPEGLPAGQTNHFAGPDAGGWVVVAIWDSRESWETFRDDVLIPALQGDIEGAFSAPPEITEFEVDTAKTA
jgi:hypothetical protein